MRFNCRRRAAFPLVAAILAASAAAFCRASFVNSGHRPSRTGEAEDSCHEGSEVCRQAGAARRDVLLAGGSVAAATILPDAASAGFVSQTSAAPAAPPADDGTVRGVNMIGWQGKQLKVPFAVANSPVSHVFDNRQWPAAWPYSAESFRRLDESEDENFYRAPRLVTHIDDDAISSIRDFYAVQFAQAPQGEYSVLDICSSWISHYPEGLAAKRVAITGMNKLELKENKQATEYVARNLNTNPKLPYGDAEFDFVTNVVSVDYLNKPQEIFKEMHRVLKPGGVAIMSFSNRCFFTKAIAMWIANMNDGPGHCEIVGNYFHFSPARGWKDISSVDITRDPRKSNPMWVVTAVKAA